MASLSALFKTMQRLTGVIHRDRPLTLALIFSRVAASGPSGVLTATLARELKLTSSQVSNSVQTLSAGQRRNATPGLGLIDVTADQTNANHQLLRLTPKGADLHSACGQ